MAKSRRRTYKRSTNRWSPNIVKVRDNIDATTTLGEFSGYAVLCSNPTQNENRVSQTYTVKNFEITFTIEANTLAALSGIEGVTAFIMFVPQGMTVSDNYYLMHPEYIMNYRYLGSPTSYAQTSGTGEIQTFQPIKMKSRLARKLQTGDAVVLYLSGYNSTTSSQTISVDGVVRWWTKAN